MKKYWLVTLGSDRNASWFYTSVYDIYPIEVLVGFQDDVDKDKEQL